MLQEPSRAKLAHQHSLYITFSLSVLLINIIKQLSLQEYSDVVFELSICWAQDALSGEGLPQDTRQYKTTLYES